MDKQAANRQWSSRPDDERFSSLVELRDAMTSARRNSRAMTISSRSVKALPDPKDQHCGLLIEGPGGNQVAATNWAFGQLASRASAPASYLSTLPPALAADCLNYGLAFREVEDIGVLLRRHDDSVMLHAATGPNYGRIWNSEIASLLVDRFGDGITGQWRVPGEFGKEVEITKRNTTIYASDRDMFVFLCDEKNRVEIPNRRDGKPGGLARGFYVWNSEVGKEKLGAAFFLFDFVCMNRTVWGMQQWKELGIRHTKGAPDRFLEEIQPVLREYSEASAKPVLQAIEDARNKFLGDKLDDFLANRFGKRTVAALKAQHESEEGRPIETLWDVSVAASAFARNVPHQDRRVELERQAGDVLKMAA